MSFDVILRFLRPIESLIKDPAVSDIMVNGPACVFIKRDGEFITEAASTKRTGCMLQPALTLLPM